MMSRIAITTFAAAMTSIACAMAAPPTAPTTLAIEPQSLTTALQAFSEQSGLQVGFESQLARGIRSPGLKGMHTPGQALSVLLEGTGLEYRFINDQTVVVRQKAAAQATQNEPATSSANFVEEVVVTGTHIRGLQNAASPVLRFSRADIETSGFSTTEQFIQSLPQNFSGGATATTASAIRGGEGFAGNISQGTGVNLRGLGNDGTLVLVNGRRLAPVGTGNFVDLSLIPLNAVERIEVITDGASAVYGSDAVGGVVNFIMRRPKDALETSMRYGTVTEGNHHQRQIAQMLGKEWGSGAALLHYQFEDHSPLGSEDRFPEADDNPTDLFGKVQILPPNKRHGALLSVSQRLTEGAQLHADVLYGKRDTGSTFYLSTDQNWSSKVEQYGATLGTTLDLSSTWQADLTAGSSEADTEFSTTLGAASNLRTTELKVRSFDAKADGALFALPGGSARLAVGGHYRRESYVSIARTASADMSRNVHAVFGEAFVPLVGAGNARTGIQRLEATIAGRYEKYSDFGSTADPKIGLLWSPVTSINVRGTYSTSFRAPIFSELDESNVLPAAFRLRDPTAANPARTTPAIVIQGNNVGLMPQQATNWTAGVDLLPRSLPQFRASLTWFRIDFRDRITVPVPSTTLFGLPFLNNPIYASVVTHNPDIAAVNAWYAHPSFRNQAQGAAPSAITAIVDERIDNVARRRATGLDLAMSYGWNTPVGALSANIDGTYLLELQDQVTPDAPFNDPLNTVSYPVDLKARGGVSWRRKAVSATAFINHTGGYRDIRPNTRGTVASWTTMDLTLSYDTRGLSADHWAGDMVIAISAQNVLNRATPFALSLTGNGLNFDPTNSNPIGRFVAVQLRKEW